MSVILTWPFVGFVFFMGVWIGWWWRGYRDLQIRLTPVEPQPGIKSDIFNEDSSR